MTRKLALTLLLAAAMLVGLFALLALADGPIVDLSIGEEDFRVVGVNALDWLGEVAAGDVNDDNIDDLIIGASGTNLVSPARENGGAVHVILGTLAGLSGTMDLDTATPHLRVYGRQAESYMGRAVASGDINGDNRDDLIIGADYASEDGHSHNGAVYVLFGSASLSGTVDLYTDTASVEIYGAADNDRLGRSMAVCDVSDDGVGDLIVGAYYFDRSPTITEAGAVYVFFGSGSLPSTIELDSDSADFVILGAEGGGRLGRSVSCGDVDGDNTADIIAGAYRVDQPGGVDAGAVYVFYGSSSLAGTLDLDVASADVEIQGVAAGDEAGFFVASGDVNGDNTGDILVGAYFADVTWPGSETGTAYVVYGSGSLASTIPLATHADITIYGAASGDRLSRSVSSGDFNADGYDDILIGASRGDPGSPARADAGISYVIYGASQLSSSIYLSDTTLIAIQVLGDDTSDEAGRATGTGDLNGDGANDVIIGAVLASGADSGEAYVIHGSAATTLTLAPASETITSGDPVTYTATASNRFGSWDVTADADFDIDPGAGGSWSDNVYTAGTVGTWTVTVNFQSLDTTATLTVSDDVGDEHHIFVPLVTNNWQEP